MAGEATGARDGGLRWAPRAGSRRPRADVAAGALGGWGTSGSGDGPWVHRKIRLGWGQEPRAGSRRALPDVPQEGKPGPSNRILGDFSLSLEA